ncbi:PIG-L family deacetylase [Myxococcota bacterium]|nr:PIG-L family deacetylase [Myxococcota bacterium]
MPTLPLRPLRDLLAPALLLVSLTLPSTVRANDELVDGAPSEQVEPSPIDDDAATISRSARAAIPPNTTSVGALPDIIDGCFGCPIDPVTRREIEPPFANAVVFFAAHPDDETIGMAAAIMHEVQAGKRVFIEMMTHGETSTVLPRLADGGTDPWHAGNHNHPMTVAAFGLARVAEVMDSAARMGVEGIFVSSFPSGSLTPAHVQTRIAWWHWSPVAGRFAVGFHSTPYLMGENNVSLSPVVRCHEYVVLP